MKILVVCTTDSMIWNFLIPHLEELNRRGHTVECACSETGFYFSELASKGYTLHKIQFTRSPISKQNIVAYKELKKLIKEGEFEAVYCHEPVGGLMGRLAGKSCKTKIIYMSHGFHFFKGAPKKHWIIYYSAEWFMSFLTDACITINKEDYTRLQHMHAKRRYYVHGIGIQPGKSAVIKDRNTIRGELGLRNEDTVLISIGELSKRKNHRVILDALNRIHDRSIKLIICGEGELEDELKAMVKKHGLYGQVFFTGFIRNVGDYIAASDAMILPSLWEGLGLVGLEALQLGVPVIGARRQGIKDYVIDGETGLLFEPHNSEELAVRIRKMMSMSFMQDKVHTMIRIANIYAMESVLKEFDLIYQKEFE